MKLQSCFINRCDLNCLTMCIIYQSPALNNEYVMVCIVSSHVVMLIVSSAVLYARRNCAAFVHMVSVAILHEVCQKKVRLRACWQYVLQFHRMLYSWVLSLISDHSAQLPQSDIVPPSTVIYHG